MPLSAQHTYTLDRLAPIWPECGRQLSKRFQASLSILKGTLLAVATSAVNAVQTITITGTPTGGTFKLTYKGFETTAIAYNASASTVAAALAALPSIGSGNVAGSGGAFPGTAVVITFQGALAGQPVDAITIASASKAFTGGTAPDISVAQTTVGVIAGGMKAWTGTLVSAPSVPTVSAVSGGTGFGDGTNSIPYVVSVTFYNESGETTPSQAATVLVTSSNRKIRVAAYSSVGANVQGAKYYVNGQYAGSTAASGGDIAQTDLTAFAAGPGAPLVNTCYACRDGSHVLKGIAATDISTDASGNITLGLEGAGMSNQEEYPETAVWVAGHFKVGDLVIAAGSGAQMERFGRFVEGTYSDSGGVFRLGYL